ncbi:MAG TPA: ribonuclease III [Candidatus Paceibacterota bacterium]|nr:ribonuclease III [Candidatus Paceibacterota bacterium]
MLATKADPGPVMSGDPKTGESPASKWLELQDLLNYRFNNPLLLELALTHPSATMERETGAQTNYQRLEFLGDAVLQLVFSSELYTRFADANEGVLTKARAQLVNSHTLAAKGRRLSLGSFLILSHGEELNGGRQRLSALADGFEALLGAIFLDSGYESVKAIILHLFEDSLCQIQHVPVLSNPKGELQELIQSKSGESPRYHLESTSGPDHDPVFESTVRHQGVELGRGRGKSKKEAEIHAALDALKKLQPQAPVSADPLEPESPTGTGDV